MKEIKAFLPRLNCKIPANKLREIFNEVDTRKRNEITFDDFTTLYQNLLLNENVHHRYLWLVKFILYFYFQKIEDIFDKLPMYSENTKHITLQEFQSFLVNEQTDEIGNNEIRCSEFISSFLKVEWQIKRILRG